MLKNNIFNLTKRYFCTPIESKIELLTKDNKKCNLYYSFDAHIKEDFVSQREFKVIENNIINYFNTNCSKYINAKDIEKLSLYNKNYPIFKLNKIQYDENIVSYKNNLSYHSLDKNEIIIDYNIETNVIVYYENISDIIKYYIENRDANEISVYELKCKIAVNLNMKDRDIDLNIHCISPNQFDDLFDVAFIIAAGSITCCYIYNERKLKVERFKIIHHKE